jgi:hypothetical protein
LPAALRYLARRVTGDRLEDLEPDVPRNAPDGYETASAEAERTLFHSSLQHVLETLGAFLMHVDLHY